MMDFNNSVYKKSLYLENILLNKGWKYVDAGYSRKVFRRKNVVIKIPMTEKGVADNIKERNIYINNRGIYAPCRLIGTALMMKAVKVLDIYSNGSLNQLIPDWAWDLHDGPQVGIYNNKVYIYDFAEE